MKKLIIPTTILCVSVFLGGCQSADDSSSAETGSEEDNSVAMNSGDNSGGTGATSAGESPSGTPEGEKAKNEASSGNPYADYPGVQGGYPKDSYKKPADADTYSGTAGNPYGNTGTPGGDPTTELPSGYPGATGYSGAQGDDPTTNLPAGYPGAQGSNYAGGPGGNPADPTAGQAYPGSGPGGQYKGGSGTPYPGAGATGTPYPGTGGPGGGSGPPQTKEGTPLHAVVQTVLAVAEGNQKGTSEFISPKSKGTLSDLRSGKLSKEKFEELKTQMARVQFMNERSLGSKKVISLKNEDGRIFRFTCSKEGETYLIEDFENTAPSKKNTRKRR